MHLSPSHLDGRGQRSALAQMDYFHVSLLPEAEVDVLTEDGSRDHFAVLSQRLQSQDCVLREVKGQHGGQRSKVSVCVRVYVPAWSRNLLRSADPG